MMRGCVVVFIVALILGMVVCASDAETIVTVTQETNLPSTIEVAAGDYITFLNGTWETAHIVVGGNEDVGFFIGDRGSRMRFMRPGTYQFTVHLLGTKPHTHRGTVIVK